LSSYFTSPAKGLKSCRACFNQLGLPKYFEQLTIAGNVDIRLSMISWACIGAETYFGLKQSGPEKRHECKIWFTNPSHHASNHVCSAKSELPSDSLFFARHAEKYKKKSSATKNVGASRKKGLADITGTLAHCNSSTTTKGAAVIQQHNHTAESFHFGSSIGALQLIKFPPSHSSLARRKVVNPARSKL
jgi:hypothetical protein